MMPLLEMKIPSPGESITEVEIATWLVKNGDYVEKDEPIAEIDSDKATLELPAEESGIITLKANEGDTIAVGEIACLIDTNAKKPATKKEKPKKVEIPQPKAEINKSESVVNTETKTTPLAKSIIKQKNIDVSKINGSGEKGKITKRDVNFYLADGFESSIPIGWGGTREKEQSKMNMLRRKIAKRLVSVKNETAMLTTFNELDMLPIMNLRKKYKEDFKKVHEVNLGFMSFFTKAVTEALNLFPGVNSQIDGEQVISHDYADIGIAVSAPKGLMVPIVRNAEKLSLAEIEKEIKRLAIKARDGKIDIADMEGGTFTITNGGVFGSMLSTPIINPPQSAILGMHNIVERPVVINKKIEIRPIMYLALSYDHRIIDGKDSVGFLKAIKEMLEDPIKLIYGNKSPEEILLNL